MSACYLIGDKMSEIQIGQVTEAWAKNQGLTVKYYKEINSTNAVAKTEAFSQQALENEFVLYVTDSQTQGRGRFDRTWSTPNKGAALISSWSFQMAEMPQPTITALVGLALFNAAKITWPFLNWSLKAPNDLLIDDKKVAGLLVETVSQGDEYRCIVGLGLNVLAFPSDIPQASSLLKHLSAETPLLGEDWIHFLERFFFELSLVIPVAHEPLNSTQVAQIIYALNENPNLAEKFESVDDLSEELWR